jgi:heavy metal translocating P-type ATPase
VTTIGLDAAPACVHCGLPVVGRAGRSRGPLFCCLGCRVAAAAAPGDGGPQAFLEARLLLSAFLAMGVMTFTFVLYGESAYGTDGDVASMVMRRTGQVGVAAFALPVLALLGLPIAKGAWSDLRQGAVRMDGLIVLGTFAAYGVSLAHTVRGHGQVYYETATMVLVLVVFGRRLEAHARSQGRNAAAALAETLPRAAHRVDAGGTVTDVDPSLLAPGDVIDVRPGEQVPADAIVLRGESDVATAHLTGESAPASVGPGGAIAAGATNGLGALAARVVRPWRDGGLGRVLGLLDAPLAMTRVMRAIDRLAGWLAAASILLALVAGAAAAASGAGGDGIRTALSVLLVACPCALGLATPLAYRAIRAALARQGVLVNDPRAFEVAPTIDVVLLDKTGTVTDPARPLVRSGSSGPDAFANLEELVRQSGHPLGRGVTRVAASAGSVRVRPGLGVETRADGAVRRAGRPEWMDAEGARWSPALASERAALDARGLTMVAYSDDGDVTALASVEQQLRRGAAEAVALLEGRGLAVAMVSGDRPGAVARIAEELRIPAVAAMSPEAKVDHVRRGATGARRVLMVGDGINDAPALRAADVSVAMGSGAAVARSQAQVEVIGDDLRALPLFLDAADVLRRVVRGNLVWTLAYNGVALAFAATGRLHPIIAAAAMIGSSLVVSVRSYRLLGFGAAAPPGGKRVA